MSTWILEALEPQIVVRAGAVATTHTQDLALILARSSISTAPHSAIKDCPMCPCFYRYAVARHPDNQHNQSCQYQ